MSGELPFDPRNDAKEATKPEAGQPPATNELPGEASDPKPEEPSKTEKRLDQVDQAFDELASVAQHSPEAQRIATEAVIGQMRQIAEQMKTVRDMQQLQELKTLMLKNWDELKTLTGNDPSLLSAIQDWGQKFIDKKILSIGLIDDVKEKLIDRAQDIQERWSMLQAPLGELSAMHVMIDHRISSAFQESSGGKMRDWEGNFLGIGGIQRLIEKLSEYSTGHNPNSADIDVRAGNNFLVAVTNCLREITSIAHQNGELVKGEGGKYKTVTIAEQNPRFGELAEEVRSSAVQISAIIKDCNKDFMLIKKIHDTHFLDLFNEQGPEVSLAA